jgi:hypothetical protein
MWTRRTFLAIPFLFALAAGHVSADAATSDELDALLSAIRANKKALIAVNLQLSEAEGAKFWPVYDKYQGELAAVQERLAKVVEDYSAHFATLSDEDGTRIVRDFLAAESDRAKVRQSYAAPFGEVLPGKKVARFYQMENKMDAVLRYALAEVIPVIEK